MSIAVGCSQLDVSYPGTVRASHYEDYSFGLCFASSRPSPNLWISDTVGAAIVVHIHTVKAYGVGVALARVAVGVVVAAVVAAGEVAPPPPAVGVALSPEGDDVPPGEPVGERAGVVAPPAAFTVTVTCAITGGRSGVWSLFASWTANVCSPAETFGQTYSLVACAWYVPCLVMAGSPSFVGISPTSR